MEALMNLLKGKIIQPLVSSFKRGLSPHTLSLSLSFAIVCSLFPVPLTTTLVCFIFVTLLSLNGPLCYVINLLLTPLQLFMIVPFLRFGEAMVGEEPLPLSPSELSARFSASFLSALSDFGYGLTLACLGWAAFSLMAVPFLYLLLFAGFSRTRKRSSSRHEEVAVIPDTGPILPLKKVD